MDSSNEVFANTESQGRKQTKQKRKWREIEAIKDKHRLLKELQEIDLGIEASFNDLDI